MPYATVYIYYPDDKQVKPIIEHWMNEIPELTFHWFDAPVGQVVFSAKVNGQILPVKIPVIAEEQAQAPRYYYSEMIESTKSQIKKLK